MIVRNPAGRRRLRVMHVILSRGFAGSERAAAESCAALAGRHAVALVVRSDHREPGGPSIRDELAPGIEVFEVPPRLGTQQRLEQIIRAWAPDVVHTHLRRGTRYVARIGLARSNASMARHGSPRYSHCAAKPWLMSLSPYDSTGSKMLTPLLPVRMAKSCAQPNKKPTPRP